MKRILLLAIAILVFIPLLSACSIQLKTPEDSRDNPSETIGAASAEPGGGKADDPAQTDEPKTPELVRAIVFDVRPLSI